MQAAVPKSASSVRIDSEHAGQRIDNFLRAHLKGVPKEHIYRCLRRGEVRVNSGRIRQTYRLQEGDVVRLPPLHTRDSQPLREPGAHILDLLDRSILHEDNALLILNKPAGIAVHGGSGHDYGVIEGVRCLRPEHRMMELVHRLDRDTSGCLMIAKKRGALATLGNALRDGQVSKQYLTLVKGRWTRGTVRVETRLKKNVLRSGERIVRIDESGKRSVTSLRPCAITGTASLLLAHLYTGRTHQIRVHASSIGHPIAGDAKYGDKAFNTSCRSQGLKRLFLHATRLAFQHPITGEKVSFVAPIPSELTTVLGRLGIEYSV